MPGFIRRGLSIALAASLVSASNPAAAYRIKYIGGQHERLTVLAERCVQSYGEGFPVRCLIVYPKTTDEFDEIEYSHSSWAETVRWPDDPTRQIYSRGFWKALAKLELGGCQRRLGKSDYAGLLCESHYGRLQFFHAMRVGNEPDELTRRRILAWTKFSFEVAKGAIDGDADFCETVEGLADLGDALAPEAFKAKYCAPPRGQAADGWKVATLYTLDCPIKCSEPPKDAQAWLKPTALGAVIHVVQDSYSQAHAARGGIFPLGPYAARIVCAPVETFYRYDKEQAKVHSDGDKTPLFDESCARTQVVDPVTATARLLWLYAHGCHSSWAVELMANGVLGGSAPARVPASPEQCRVAT